MALQMASMDCTAPDRGKQQNVNHVTNAACIEPSVSPRDGLQVPHPHSDQGGVDLDVGKLAQQRRGQLGVALVSGVGQQRVALQGSFERIENGEGGRAGMAPLSKPCVQVHS